MIKILKTIQMLLIGAAVSAISANSAFAYDPEPIPAPALSLDAEAFVEVPSNSYFYQNIISRDGDVMSDVPVIIDFNATWCGPCRQLKPILQKVAREYGSRIKVFSVDIDKVSAQNEFFEFDSIPYLVFVTPDGEWDDITGYVGEQQLKSKIREMFGL